MLTAEFLTSLKLRVKAVGLFRGIFYFPNLVTPACIAILFQILLDWQYGSVNQILFGMNKDAYVNWMGDPLQLQLLIAGIQTWQWFGNTLLVAVAGLLAISPSYLEAARVEGAGPIGIFFRVKLPMIQPIMLFVVITSFIGGMQIMDVPYMIANPPGSAGVDHSLLTILIYTYKQAFVYGNYGYSAALSFVQFVLIGMVSLAYMRLTRQE